MFINLAIRELSLPVKGEIANIIIHLLNHKGQQILIKVPVFFDQQTLHVATILGIHGTHSKWYAKIVDWKKSPWMVEINGELFKRVISIWPQCSENRSNHINIIEIFLKKNRCTACITNYKHFAKRPIKCEKKYYYVNSLIINMV